MQKLHPIEALLLVAMATVWAVLTIARAVLVPAVALVLTLADRRPAAPEPEPVPAEPAPAAPLQHPLAGLAAAAAEALAGHTVAQLRTMARQAGLPRALSRSGRRADLISALAVMEAAVI